MDWIICHCFPLLFLELFLECITDAQSMLSILKIKAFLLSFWPDACFSSAFLKQNQIYFLCLLCLVLAVKRTVSLLVFVVGFFFFWSCLFFYQILFQDSLHTVINFSRILTSGRIQFVHVLGFTAMHPDLEMFFVKFRCQR